METLKAIEIPGMKDRALAEFKSLGGTVDEILFIDESAPRYTIDVQYLFMNDWAFNKLYISRPGRHVDIGSQLPFLFHLSNFFPVTFVDIRDPGISLKRFSYLHGDITNLALDDNSIDSLSSLHVAEHIGLGRYGDKLDPDGFYKACSELSRVLAVGGKLYFAVPCGIPKVFFNAHRVLGVPQVIEAFGGLKLTEFSAITSSGVYARNTMVQLLENDPYGVGLFEFTK